MNLMTELGKSTGFDLHKMNYFYLHLAREAVSECTLECKIQAFEPHCVS
jgi:hypothetical protein